jgi:hypothetical protein
MLDSDTSLLTVSYVTRGHDLAALY